jgi:CHAT domain-containing protein
MSRFLPLLLVALALPLRAADLPESAVSQFYAAFAAGDLRAASSVIDAPAAGPLIRRTERFLRTRCITVHRLTLSTLAVNDDAATVEAEALVTIASDATNARPRIETQFTTFDLKRTDRWRIVRWTNSEDLFAERVMALKSEEERDSLLAKAGRLHSPRLAEAMCRQAIAASNREDPDNAVAAWRMAREIALETGDDVALSTVLGVESVIWIWGRTFDPPRAVEVGREGLALAERSGDPDAIARALLRLGRAQFSIDMKVVRAPFERILALAEIVTDTTILANAASQLSLAANEANDRRGHLRHALTALQFAEMSGEISMLYNAYFVLGEAYAFQGQADLCVRNYSLMHDAAKQAGYADGVGLSLLRIAECYKSLGLAADVARTIERALPVADTETLAHLLHLRGTEAMARSDFESAERDLEAAMRTIPAEDPTRIEIRGTLTGLRLRQGRHQEALDLAEESVRIAAGNSPRERLTASYWSVRTLRTMRRLEDAGARLAEMLRLLDEEQTSAAIDETRSSDFHAHRSRHYVEAVLLALDLGDPAAALQAAERMKGRALRAALERESDRSTTLMTRTDRARVRAINSRIAELNRELLGSRIAASGRSELDAAIARARLDLEELRSRVALQHGGRAPVAPALDDILASAQDFTVLEYVRTDDELVIIAVLPGRGSARRIVAKRVAIAPGELSGKIERLLQLLEARDLRYARAGREMYELLLEPVRDLIPSGSALCLIPDGEIWRVPFQALRGPNGKYLAETTPLFYAPSLAFADLTRTATTRRRSNGDSPTLLAFANPELHARSVAQYRSAFSGVEVGALQEAEDEVRGVARLYGSSRSRVYVGDEASEANLKRQSGRYAVVHIATHGAVDPTSPFSSAMLLAPGSADEDGLLEAREILDLEIESDLAVLSACSTGAGKTHRGEGVVGLSWAFLASGCPTTVVSQWKTESSVTARLMIEFHRRLRSGESAATALRHAQARIRGEHRYRHPFYWAPFAVVGAQ